VTTSKPFTSSSSLNENQMLNVQCSMIDIKWSGAMPEYAQTAAGRAVCRQNDQAKMYGKNKELLIIGRERAYGFWKKASSRIKKKIGRQALWTKYERFRAVF
jgi:hypothetical protein